jgi:hypothetical protein
VGCYRPGKAGEMFGRAGADVPAAPVVRAARG